MKASQYRVLDNRPIDQWKVTELKEELKRRKLITRGLKEDLIKRLDEAIRAEQEAAQEADNGVDDEPEPETADVTAEADETVVETSDAETVVPVNAEDTGTGDDGKSSKLDSVSTREDVEDHTEQTIQDNNLDEKESELVDGQPSKVESLSATLVDGQPSKVESLSATDAPSADVGNEVGQGLPSETLVDEQGLQDDKMERDNEDSNAEQGSDDVKPSYVDVKLDTSDSNNQVSEVSTNLGFHVKSNSISTDSVSINEKNELEDNIIADDNVKLEPDVKPEMVQPSSSDLVPDGGESHLKDVEEPHENKVSVEEIDNVTNADLSQKNHSADLGSSEKLNLDRSSGDDSMEEDASESKQIDSKFNSEEVGQKTEKSDTTTVKEESSFVAMDTDLSAEDKIIPAEEKSIPENKDAVAASSEKRKLPEQEAVPNNEPSKRQRRWKSETTKAREPQISDIAPPPPPPPSAPKDLPSPAVLKRNFSRSDSVGANDSPKEREVPPSTKPATNSLRIDRFLRPFTLKAVQELLGKTGTVTSFWMDHIKTHCYVTYSSVEEAVDMRNAVYNLQWPPNGGRNLIAEFVDPEEVKLRLEPPPQPAPAPVSAGPTAAPEPPSLPQPSPRQQNLKQQMSQQPTLPPPPPLTNPAKAREWAHPPPPPQEKVDAPIVTLDDLFRKTKATPRIYYLPLSEEQVAKKAGRTA